MSASVRGLVTITIGSSEKAHMLPAGVDSRTEKRSVLQALGACHACQEVVCVSMLVLVMEIETNAVRLRILTHDTRGL